MQPVKRPKLDVATIESLPAGVIALIAEYLSFAEVSQLSQVSRHFTESLKNYASDGFFQRYFEAKYGSDEFNRFKTLGINLRSLLFAHAISDFLFDPDIGASSRSVYLETPRAAPAGFTFHVVSENYMWLDTNFISNEFYEQTIPSLLEFAGMDPDDAIRNTYTENLQITFRAEEQTRSEEQTPSEKQARTFLVAFFAKLLESGYTTTISLPIYPIGEIDPYSKYSMKCNICDTHAIVKCCNQGLYCSETCQKSDWASHQIWH